MYKKLLLIIVPITFFFILACSNNNDHLENVKYDSLEAISPTAWKHLANKKIVFGHHSVGRNILAGMQDLIAQHSYIKLNFVDFEETSQPDEGYFGHFKVGQNRDPQSKTQSFSELMSSSKLNPPDISFFKYCFVDFDKHTDIQAVFRDYQQTMKEIKDQFPNTILVHFTVPLRTTDLKYNLKVWYDRVKRTKYWKNKIRRIMLINSYLFDYAENAKRNDFNQLLIRSYEGKEPIFDIARIESTYPDGKEYTYSRKGRKYLSLIPEYSSDGAHLNEIGSKRVAEALLLTLVNVAQKS